MKRILSITLTLLAGLHVTAQRIQYAVQGTAPASMEKVYLIDLVTQRPIDSTLIKNDRFSLSCTTQPNQFISVGNSAVSFATIADGTPITIDFNRATLKGSPLNERLHGYDLHSSLYQSAMNRAYMMQNRQRLDSLQGEWFNMMKQAVRENPDNLIPALFMNYIGQVCEYDELRELLSPDKAYYAHPLSAAARQQLADCEIKAPGKPFTDFTMNDINDRPRKLSDWCGKGNYVLVVFWASWWESSIYELDAIQELYKEYRSKGFQVVGVSLDVDKDYWRCTVNERHLRWPHLCDLLGWESEAIKSWGIHSIPTSVLVGPDGRIAAINLTGDKIADKLEEVYNE